MLRLSIESLAAPLDSQENMVIKPLSEIDKGVSAKKIINNAFPGRII